MNPTAPSLHGYLNWTCFMRSSENRKKQRSVYDPALFTSQSHDPSDQLFKILIIQTDLIKNTFQIAGCNPDKILFPR